MYVGFTSGRNVTWVFPHEQWLHDGYMYAEQICVKLRLLWARGSVAHM